MADEITGYQLSRAWFDWCFENPEKITPTHSAIYFFAIEHCNRLGWKQKFGFPTRMTMDAIGIKRTQTYIEYLNDLVEWGFIKMIERSKNQHSSNIIELTAPTEKRKALGKAVLKHASKHRSSKGESIDTIDKPITYKPLTIELYQSKEEAFEEIKLDDLYMDETHRLITGKGWRSATKVHLVKILKTFLIAKADITKEKSEIKQHFKNWLFREKLNDLVKITDEG